MTSMTKNKREIDLGMSNFDGSIDEGLSEALQAEPDEVFGRHAGWNFNGKVWFQDGKFHEEVWVFGSLQQVISADTLSDLMEEVCAEYGND